MKNQSNLKIKSLLEKGVKIPNTDSVEIGEDVDISRIAEKGVVIYSGCKIYGKSTLILQGAKLGYEGPVTVKNCHIGADVELKGGFFKEAVFLQKASMGSCSHVREGTILEEQANAAHAVGLKHTILFPFVTLGSLINFCDVAMSGGTSRQNHSEVGSSYIHFNYTPNQDKATPSLIGNVAEGVMLNQKPIFLGGQGGIIGPCRLAFGATIAAGVICRKDELRQERLIFGGSGKAGNISFTKSKYQNIDRIVVNNIIYIANLIALMQWYKNVRSQFISDVFFTETLFEGLKEKLNMAIDERIKRLKNFCLKMPDDFENKLSQDNPSLFTRQKKQIYENWDAVENSFEILRCVDGVESLRNEFLEKIYYGIKNLGKNYLSVIKNLEGKSSKLGSKWLQQIVDHITFETLKILPLFNPPKT